MSTLIPAPSPTSVTCDIYVANRGDNTVSVIDGITDTVIATIPVGNVPIGVGILCTS